MAISVLGVGFGRTGTLSFKIALEKLGIAPCYHMIEVVRNLAHVGLWDRAADGKPIDWDGLYSGYTAAVDWPTCYFWRELAEHYPDAKVVLTVRDPERWYKSVSDTIYPELTRAFRGDDPLLRARHAMGRKVILERTFDDRFADRSYALEVFRSNNEEVRRIIPAARLLVYEVSEGWGPLCRFLGRPIPDEAFPRVNSTSSFRQRVGINGP